MTSGGYTQVWYDEAADLPKLRKDELRDGIEALYERHHSVGRANRLKLLRAGTSMCANPRFLGGYNVR